MKKTFLSLFIFLLSFSAFACLNGETKELANGLLIYHDDGEQSMPIGHEFMGANQKLLSELDSLYQATKEVEYLSDKGYVLIELGKYAEAIRLYLDIERVHPNRYSTASNIGTAYELIGQNKEALKWIKKAIQIDPKSHEGSEWLHVKILEAKLKGDSAINGSFLINTSFGEAPVPITGLSKDWLNILRYHLFYQLNERISFVKPKDKIVATLLFEFANILLIQQDRENA